MTEMKCSTCKHVDGHFCLHPDGSNTCIGYNRWEPRTDITPNVEPDDPDDEVWYDSMEVKR
jgi:hypothetical protein